MVSMAALNSIYSTIMKRPTINYGSFIAIIIIISVFYEADCQSLHRSFFDNDQSSIARVKRQSTRFNNQIKLQRFLIEPENVTVDIGESIQLPCRVSNKAGTVQWTRDGFGLGADPRLEGFPTYSMLHNDATGDYSLKISSVTLEDDAIFQCQVGAVDNVPGIRSQNARLTVRVRPEDPVIVLGNLIPYHHHLNNNLQQQELQVLSTTAGNKIELTCESHGGRPAAELSWINSKNRVVKKGITSKITPMNDGKRYNVALKWQFEPTKNDHQKRLYCRASHPTYVTSNTTSPMTSIMLEVKYAPEVKLEVSRVIDQQPPSQPLSVIGMSNLHGRVGDTLRFRCVADGNPGKNSMVYEWLRNNEVIMGDHGQELVIDNVDKSFNGAEIQCRVGNPVGTGQSSIKLNIAYGPYFLPSMEYVYGANLGDTVRLACAVDGNPTPEITWIKVGTSSVMSSGPKLTIRDVQPENVGEYLCRVSVKGFTEISAIVYLRLNGPPKIRKTSIVSSSTTSSSTYNLLYPFNDNNIVGAVQHHQQYYGKQSISSIPNNRFYAVPGESAHLECLVESVPAPIAITWIHNGQIFTSGSANNIPINIDIFEETVKEEMVVQRASFNIRQTFENDFGYYNCVVINSYGSDWHFISLEKKTSFSTIVIIVAIAISILMFVVLTTIILLLTIKHRNLLKQQRQQRHLQQQNQKSHNPESDGGDQNGVKEHYMAQIMDSDNHNIYSTHSTRTNSSANYFIDKLNQPLETGTIITRSGSTGSQRSSTSSTFPVYLDHHRASSSSPGPGPVINDSNVGGGGGGIISRTINSLHNHQRRSSPNHASSNNHRPMSPPSYFNNSIFETSSTNNDLMMITSSNKSGPVIAMPPITSTNYSTLINKHLPNSNRNSYSPYLAQQFYQQQQQQQFDNLSQSNLGSKDPSANTNDMYQANPYSIVQSSSSAAAAAADKGFDSRIKSTPMPTRPPSIAKELDNCISNTSIATHV